MKSFEMLVNYGDKPITRLIIKCPNCGKWFDQLDVVDDTLNYESELDAYTHRVIHGEDYDDFNCPNCSYNPYTDNDSIRVSVKEADEFPEVAKKKVTWE